MDYKTLWEDCTIGFICPNCGVELSADSQNGPETCVCGLEYNLVVTLHLSQDDKEK